MASFHPATSVASLVRSQAKNRIESLNPDLGFDNSDLQIDHLSSTSGAVFVDFLCVKLC
jgi:hypothetical protein